jgi:hypothetical protein
MNETTQPTGNRLKTVIIAILIAGAALQLLRIAQVRSTGGEVPFLSANDRSRWCTIASLAVKGTYEIDSIIEVRHPKTRRRTWYSIDMVRHRGTDGNLHYYSSKPPLLPTLYTGVYFAIRTLTGTSLMKHTFFVARTMLVLVNLVPLVLLWWVMARWTLRELGGNAWGITVAVVFLVFGTFLSTFSNTLNNHLPAAIACGFSLFFLEKILNQKQLHWGWFAGCGFATSFTAANEMPALCWLAAVTCLLLMANWRRALFVFGPAMLPVAIGFFLTNYLAHGVLRPAYAHRDLGALLFEFPVNPDQSIEQIDLPALLAACRTNGQDVSETATIRSGRRPGVLELWDEARQRRLGLRLDRPDRLGVYEWDDWYDYPGSYWIEGRKQGVDKGEPSLFWYSFHCLIGHHGVFSLTPIWLISLWGFVDHFRRRSPALPTQQDQVKTSTTQLHLAIMFTSVICIGFYLTRPLEDRNYGGVTSGLRWLFWLTPLWYWLLLQAFKSSTIPSHSRVFRRLTEFALVVSIFSANYPFSNPWTSPWPYQDGPKQVNHR